MKKILIFLFIIFCFTSCFTIDEKSDTLIVSGCSNTNIREMTTTYKISAYGSDGYWSNIIKCKAKIGTFEIGDTLILIKK